MNQKKTLVLGASPNPTRYSYLAIERLRQKEHPVIAVGLKTGQVADVALQKEWPEDTDIDTVSVYMNAGHQQQYHEPLLALAPKRIIFNPGAENESLKEAAAAAGIETLEACTLVMLATQQY